MLNYLAVLGLSLTWFLALGFGGKQLLRPTSRLAPRLQLALWLGALYSLVVSLLTALAASVVLVIGAWFALDTVTPGRSNLWIVVLVSLLPWITLGSLAALAATVLIRLEPALRAARTTGKMLEHRTTATDNFQGLEVMQLQAEVPLALVADRGRKPVLLISTRALALLGEDELQAVLWHEYAHAVYQHNGIKRVAATSSALAPMLPLARSLPSVVEALCEQWADAFAQTKVAAGDLAAARAKFNF